LHSSNAISYIPFERNGIAQRNYIMVGPANSSEINTLMDEKSDIPLESRPPSRLFVLARKAPLTTSLSPQQREAEPSKLRTQSSRMLSALKSLTNSSE